MAAALVGYWDRLMRFQRISALSCQPTNSVTDIRSKVSGGQ